MAPSAVNRGGPRGGVKPGMVGGKGKVLSGAKRHRKIARDTIRGITKPDIRRLARRGGVKRISSAIYDDARGALVDRLRMILHDCFTMCEYRAAKTITVHDVIFALRRLGRPIYGFDPDTYDYSKKRT